MLLPVEPARRRAGALGYAAEATRSRPVVHGQTAIVDGFCWFLTHGGTHDAVRRAPSLVVYDLEPGA